MRRAVVLMNLGGPDAPGAVRPFLYNLFSDPAIIRLPAVLRVPLAALIAARRTKIAGSIYAELGGASPLLANTEAQAAALQALLGADYRCFVAMRYWHPFSAETADAVKDWQPDEIILLPLYPQYSTTTTGSSEPAWRDAAAHLGLTAPQRVIRSYPKAGGFIAALAGAATAALQEAAAEDHPIRLLFSAHGLPLRIVRTGDPYPQEVEETAWALAAAIGRPNLDWRLCYQSRVGPLAWLGPSVDDELRQAAADRVGVVVAPISFVSEHSETLVELDRDYRRMAVDCGVPSYRRAATVGSDPRFIAALAELVLGAERAPDLETSALAGGAR